jgi:hypothetical protein
MKRAFLWVATAIALTSFHSADTQQAKKIPLIGYLANTASGTGVQIEAFRDGLRELGRVEGLVINMKTA